MKEKSCYYYSHRFLPVASILAEASDSSSSSSFWFYCSGEPVIRFAEDFTRARARTLRALMKTLITPERWDRIAQIKSGFGDRLPSEPDAAALEAFLARRRKTEPEDFPDLSGPSSSLLAAACMRSISQWRATRTLRAGDFVRD